MFSDEVPEALVSQFRLGDADAVDVARRKARRAGEADIERVEIGALAAQIPGFQHEADVADAAAARFRIPKRVVDDPLVDCARFLDVGLRAAGDLGRRRFHDAVGRQKLCRPQKMLATPRDPLWAACPARRDRRHKSCVATRLVSVRTGFTPAGNSAAMIPSASGLLSTFRRAALRVEGCRERLLEGRLADERRWQPDARGARRIQDFDARRHFERAPMVNRCVCCKNSPSFREC